MSIRLIDVKSGPVALLKDTKNMQWFSKRSSQQLYEANSCTFLALLKI